jgi:peptidoglycan hydrolase-like protein with peptidoglycan-binding domain
LAVRSATRAAIALSLAIALGSPAAAQAAGSADVAALQVAMRAIGLYQGTIDGVAGPATRGAVSRFQARHGLQSDGVAGPLTRSTLGRRGGPSYGTRTLERGDSGWDVAALQFRLAWHGFPSATFDGGFGAHTEAAVRRFQAYAGLGVDGVAGPGTLRALRAPVPSSPIWLLPPLAGKIGDFFGPRGSGFHPGIDYPAPSGTAVAAAGRGLVVFAGWDSGGYGKLVVVEHPLGVRSMYAHLSRTDVSAGQRVIAGTRVGLVGATGFATGPHLHFELRLRGAALNPLTALR